MANAGEHILIRREPGNPYDSNAIRVDNVAGVQIGHIPRKVAEKLAKYIDNRWLRIEGQLAGEKGPFDCPLTLYMFGPRPETNEGKLLRDRMKQDKLPTTALIAAEKEAQRREKARQEAEKKRAAEEKKRLAEARRAAAGGKGGRVPAPQGQYANQHSPGEGSQAVMSDILEASQRISPRDFRVDSEQMGMSEDDLSSMPMASKPDAIKTEMLPYQLQALSWLLSQESPVLPGPDGASDAVQLWSRSRHGYTNLASNYTTNEPKLASGGILADDMGLGKTLEMISLIVADAEKYGRGTTLIVAPVSVMSNWTTQVEAHVRESNMLKVYTYHGASKNDKMGAEDFAKYGVVLTSYQTLAGIYMPGGGGKNAKKPERKFRETGLYSMEWRRVILDEGHCVRNPQTKGAAAVYALMSRSRWVLTGTPIVNSLRDLYSLLKFIGITGGLNQLEIFNSALVRPLTNGDESARLLLQATMRAFTLRRRKDMAFVDLRLPKLDEFVHRIEFTDNERKRYDALNVEAQGLLKDYKHLQNGGNKTLGTYNHVLEILLRMRQCCNHWGLCKDRVSKLLAQLGNQKTVALTEENIKALQTILQVQIESSEECAICLEVLHEPVITTCGHAFGRACIERVIEGQQKCPMCRAALKDAPTCLVEAAHQSGDESADDELDLNQSSSKLEGLMKILGATKDDSKTIVFSQWTSFLDIVGASLQKDGFTFCRLDGTMTATKRDEAITDLNSDPETTIMLASLGACSVGLNLTAASNVILCDTWWGMVIPAMRTHTYVIDGHG